MAVLSFDELNQLKGGNYQRRSVPYDNYFGEMDLPKQEQKKRKEFSLKFEEIMFFLFSLLAIADEYGYEDQEFIERELVKKYSELVLQYIDVDEYLENYIDEFAKETIATTKKNKQDPYYESEDRAMYIAENESNTIFNYAQFVTAIKDGYKTKTWNTERDRYVRHSHTLVESKTVNIDMPFVVGDSLMMFPKDTSYDANPKEIVNCRCTITFNK